PNVMSGRLGLAFGLVLEDACHVWDLTPNVTWEAHKCELWDTKREGNGHGYHIWSLACTKLKRDLD
ncbi:hypothetical protein PIB30_112905, partial [Stylosanthes scabra]|nr:hypothetical protein [Stylosanthes scabra]